jgi:hypothetical protein
MEVRKVSSNNFVKGPQDLFKGGVPTAFAFDVSTAVRGAGEASR